MISEWDGNANDAMPGCHAVVLCGGAGRRMGTRKERLEFNGEPLLLRLCRSLSEIAERVTVVAERKREYEFLPGDVRVIEDDVAEFGPIAGICAGMAASELPLQLVVACDYPLAGPTVWRALAETMARHPEADAVLPEAGGKLHPLCALYRSHTLSIWQAALVSGNRRVMEATERMRFVKWLPGANASDQLMNMNTPEDYRLAKERLRS
ncbi:molybdopterin-guanine dinucleotide biosynthesis protein A [Cohnella sp. OV330]|uniref:molybdenum cofactor guanylyltransferase n=1 Tax=Cohnella sp. OV330 TaxID=1855288 RepID=UPI0008E7575B|nr:molybdenum cofactor guanylyltransferase [Cohnella sp. OV330]SFB27454.1 molybdopterin-guanine dinucleotide biosynthesis protein A [Cohnella sp. OV330]